MERRVLWNRWVAVVFLLPAIGYLAFLSQFWLGEPSGVVAAVLQGLFLFALPLLSIYSALLDVLPDVSQSVGTAGFFVFAYAFAVAAVAVVRRVGRAVAAS